MIGALVALLALPPQLLWAAARLADAPPGRAPASLSAPALGAPVGVPGLAVVPLDPALPLPAAASAQSDPSAPIASPLVPSEAAASARAAAPDPRREGFQRRAWVQAEQLGFVRDGAPVEDLPSNGASPDPASTLSPAAPGDAPRRAGPPKPRGPRPRSLRSRSVLGFFSSFALVQVAVESLGLAVPQLTVAHGFMTLGLVSATSCLAYSLGSVAGGRLVARWGIAKVYPMALIARSLIWTTAALTFDPTLQTIPVAELAVLFSLDYFAHSVGAIAEHTLQVSWFRASPGSSSRFGALRDFFEYGAIFGMLGTGLAIVSFGFGAVVYASPFLFGVAALISLAMRSLPGRRAAAAPHVVANVMTGFKALLAAPALRMLFFGQLLLTNFLYLLYEITATVFSALAAHGDAARAALIASTLTGAYGLGALAGIVAVLRMWRRIEKKTEGLSEAESSAAQSALLSRSASKALLWAAAALLGSWLFLSQAPLATVIWPLFAVTPALAVIGLTSQIAINLLDTIFKARLPPEHAASILGAEHALTYLSYAVSFLLWAAIFSVLQAQGFLALALSCTLIAGAYVWLSFRLRR